MIKKCDDCGIEIKTVAKCWGCEYFQKVINKSPKNLAQPDAYSLLADVRAILSVGICEKDYKYLDKALDLINKSEHFS